MNDYERIAEVIRYLDAHYGRQPDLDEVAQLLGLSPFHFHRVFRRWAGITPKAFIQCLTLAAAREALREGRSVLDTAYDVGLSGPGRLHDLCIKWEAATPGEIKAGGADLNLTFGIGDTPFGPGLAAWTPRGLAHLAFLDAANEEFAVDDLRRRWPRATPTRDDAKAQTWLALALNPEELSERRDLAAWVQGSPFQIKVWRALIAIPAGQLVSYGDLARAIERPGAARAIGSAVAANPLAFLIPCHRVIRESGAIGDYRWRHGRKRTLIAWERALAHS